MKKVTEYEPNDIDIEGNDLHRTLVSALALNTLLWPHYESKIEANKATQQDLVERAKPMVAMFLNLMEKSGYAITPIEKIPEAFLK